MKKKQPMTIKDALAILRINEADTDAQNCIHRELANHPYTGQDAFEEARNYIRRARYVEAAEILARFA